MRTTVPLDKAYLLLNHGPTTLVTSAFQSKRNVMAAAWAMAIDFDPPKVAVVISGDAHSRSLIEPSGEFGISLPTPAQADLTFSAGRTTGSEIDKFSTFSINTFPAEKIKAPLIEGCIGWLECKIIPEPHLLQNYDMLIGEVVNAWVDADVFTSEGWRFTEDKVTLHHLSRGSFAIPTRTIKGKKLFPSG